jgi:hypothetical protein
MEEVRETIKQQKHLEAVEKWAAKKKQAEAKKEKAKAMQKQKVENSLRSSTKSLDSAPIQHDIDSNTRNSVLIDGQSSILSSAQTLSVSLTLPSSSALEPSPLHSPSSTSTASSSTSTTTSSSSVDSTSTSNSTSQSESLSISKNSDIGSVSMDDSNKTVQVNEDQHPADNAQEEIDNDMDSEINTEQLQKEALIRAQEEGQFLK